MSEYSELGLPKDFNPMYQIMNYTSVEGPNQVSFAEIEGYVHVLLKNGFIFSTRIGAGGLAMIVLFLISNNRRSPVFLLNQLSLFLMMMHSGLYLNYLLGRYASITYYFTGFTDGVITDQALNVYAATNVFQMLLIGSIEASLVFQIKTMFKHPNGKLVGYAVVGLSFLIALATTGLYFYTAIDSIINLFDQHNAENSDEVLNAQYILFASSINFMSFVLVVKLVMAIRSRRYLGLKQFDSFHILLIMSTQSMIIPSILSIFSYTLPAFKVVALPAVAVMMIVLSLPLSSMWASSANNAPTPTSSGYHVYTPSTLKGSSFYNDQGTTLREDTDSYRFNRNKKNQYDEDIYSHRSSNNDIEAAKEADFEEKELYTPTTAAEEEAKKYWMANNDLVETEGEDEYVARTTHRLNSDYRA